MPPSGGNSLTTGNNVTNVKTTFLNEEASPYTVCIIPGKCSDARSEILPGTRGSQEVRGGL